MARSIQRREMKTVDGSLERAIPHNLEAEEALLGAMLLSRDAIADAVEFCQASDFYKPSHAAIFEALTQLHAQGESVDPVSVAEELRRHDKYDLVGGTTALLELQANTPTIASAARYARIVEEYSLLRKLIKVATEVSELAYSVPENVGAVLDLAESLIFEISERKSTDSLVSIKEVLLKTLDDLQAQYENPDSVTGIATGFVELDEILSGMQRSSLIIVGARPGMGKTSFALGIATQVATRSNLPVLVFSLEMSHMELTQRILASEARVDSRKMRTGNLSEEDWSRISRALGQLGDAPIFIDDNAQVTILDIRAKARRLKASMNGLGLVVVDYLQLMSGGYKSESRQVEVSEISRGLKLLAREIDVPVLALSQLSRGLEMRADKRPGLADLRESGCIAGNARITIDQLGNSISLQSLHALFGGYGTEIVSFDGQGQLVTTHITEVRASGIKPLYRLVLESGKTLDATLNHRFFTQRGWKMLWQLNQTDQVAVRTSDLVAQAERVSVAQRSAFCVGDGVSNSFEEPVRGLTAFEAVKSAEFVGYQPTYDIAVAKNESFVANEIVVHNSLEQDADVVMFIYRDENYNPDSQDKGIAEILVSKHRNGPTGVARLSFIETYTKFANMARGYGPQ